MNGRHEFPFISLSTVFKTNHFLILRFFLKNENIILLKIFMFNDPSAVVKKHKNSVQQSLTLFYQP